MAQIIEGRLRLLADTLHTRAEHLGVTVEELVGAPPTKRTAGKRGSQSKFAQQIQLIEALPKANTQAVSQVLESVIVAHQ